MTEDDFPSPYCEDCGACGEEWCCKPTRCKDGLNCLYPDYLATPRVAYMRLDQIMEVLDKNLPTDISIEKIKRILDA
jgi:hypothetical protein